MLATLAQPPLIGKGLIFEPKYDGIRALVHIAPGNPRPESGSGLGSETTRPPSSPPSSARSNRWPLPRAPLFIDGEIVALDERAGRPVSSGCRDGSMSRASHDIEVLDRAQPTAFIAFDLLSDGRLKTSADCR